MSENIKEQENFLAPIQIETDSPYVYMRKLSADHGIPVEFIDFRIQNIVTSYTNEENLEPVVLNEDELKIFDDDEFFLDTKLHITQNYHLEFYDKRLEEPIKLPKISIGVNSLVTKIIVKVHRSNECKYVLGYEKIMFDYIAKQLMKAQILIGIRMGDAKEELLRIASILRVKDMIDTERTFTLTSGINPVKSIDAQTIYHYKTKFDNEENKDKIDYASRGFLLGVMEDELIIEQLKPKNGSNGRDVRGKFIYVPEAKVDGEPEINITPNIIRTEDEVSVKFTAKTSGYVIEDKGVYDIQDRLEINEINFKNTGSVQTGLDSNVTLVVKETDAVKDAIGTGVVVEANEVEIKGNVASNAVVKANRVVIGGQTHAKAKIYAKDANIGIHIGYVEGDDVSIDRLENGSVVGKNVTVKSVIGGSITAENIYVETLGSNCTLTAQNLIEVKYLRGTNNRFIIDTGRIKDDSEEDMQTYVKHIEELRAELVSIKKHLGVKKNIIDENRNSIYLIKAKVEELTKSKVIPPVTFMKKLKEYQELVTEYNSLLKEHKDKKELILTLKEKLNAMQNSIFEAKIINRSTWIDLNEIKFILVDPPQNITYSTKQNEMARVISLEKVENEDGETEYKIKRSNRLEEFEQKQKQEKE